MTQPPSPDPLSRMAQLLPALLGAFSFACADVLTRIILQSGADVLTLALVRGLIGLPLLTLWIVLGARPAALTRREAAMSFVVGILFAGIVVGLFKAIEAVPVPIAVLTYFVYPVLTGLAAAATGIEPLGWRGALAALAAFSGLALMIGAQPGGVVLAGVGSALFAACCRVSGLLLTRATLSHADPRLVSWYSTVSTTVVFALPALATWNWQPPQSALGWAALFASSLAVTVAVLAVFISTVRVGPFRTALFMNLEPLLATVGSALVLGEVITPLQALGGAIMIAALLAFQLRR